MHIGHPGTWLLAHPSWSQTLVQKLIAYPFRCNPQIIYPNALLLGAVNHYWQIFPYANSTFQLFRQNFIPTVRKNKTAFKCMQILIVCECLCTYPNHNKLFHIHCFEISNEYMYNPRQTDLLLTGLANSKMPNWVERYWFKMLDCAKNERDVNTFINVGNMERTKERVPSSLPWLSKKNFLNLFNAWLVLSMMLLWKVIWQCTRIIGLFDLQLNSTFLHYFTKLAWWKDPEHQWIVSMMSFILNSMPLLPTGQSYLTNNSSRAFWCTYQRTTLFCRIFAVLFSYKGEYDHWWRVKFATSRPYLLWIILFHLHWKLRINWFYPNNRWGSDQAVAPWIKEPKNIVI